ncbi:MAG TPA: AsmA family protein [Gallionella sp.]
MNKILKYGLVGTAVVATTVIVAVVYVAATFDPNDYKPKIIAAVKESQQRTLRLDGDIKLTFFPNLGADLGKISLSEFNSEQEFASVEHVHLSLALLPLLSRQAVVDEVAINGLKATLVKYRDGKSNIDDLKGGAATEPQQSEEAGQPVQFDIASVRIENTELHYRDETTGAEYGVKNLNLNTGRIAERVPSKIGFSARIEGNQPRLELAAAMQGTVIFDLAQNAYQVSGMDLQVKGAVQDISNLVVQTSGDASANIGKQEFSANKLKMSVSGIREKDRFEARLDMPSLSLTNENYSSGKVVFDARLDGQMGNVVASLSLPGIEGNANAFRIGMFTLDAEVKQPEQTIKARLTSPVQGNLQQRQFKLPDLKLAAAATGDKLSNKAVSSELKGSLELDAAAERVQASLAGGLLQSKLAANLKVDGFTKPVIRFDVDIDQFDSDMYIPRTADVSPAAVPSAAAGTPKTRAATSEQPFDLSGLRQLDLQGGLRIGSLKVANVKLAQLRMEMKAHNGQLDISPLSAKLYQGGFAGSIGVNARQAIPVFTINQNVTGIDIGALLKDAAGLDTVSGKGSASISIDSRGNTVSALKKAVGGKMSLSLSNGVFRQDGKNYSGEVKGSAQIDGGKQHLQADVSGRLQQSRFNAKLALSDFDDPAIRFDVDLDQLDVDQYLPKQQQEARQNQASVPEEPFDLSALNKLNAEGGLRIGSFKVMNLKLAQVRLDIKAHKGIVNVNPLSANLYQGSMNGSLSVNAQSVSRFTINESLSNVAIAPLIKDLMDLDAVEGRGNVMLDLNTQGNLVGALKKALNGNASVNLENGAIRGINLTKLMLDAQNIGKGATTQTLGVSEGDKTEFSEFKATFKVSNGVAHNDDLSVKSPQLKISGGGDIDVGNERIDYTVKAMLQQAQGSDYLVVPVQLSGPFADVKFRLDYTGMLEELARRKLAAKAQELKNKAVEDARTRLQEELQKGLKGLFK